MTLVIKGQEITANSLSGRRRVHGPAPKIFTAPHVRNSCRDPIVTTTTFAKVSYVHEKMQEKRKKKETWVILCDRSESTQINRLKGS